MSKAVASYARPVRAASIITAPRKTSQQGSVEMEMVWNLQRLSLVNHNGGKMVDVRNANKDTEARTKNFIDSFIYFIYLFIYIKVLYI